MRVRFGPYTLDTGARQLAREGEPVHLSPKAFDLLAILLEQRPAVVEKAALRERLWPGVHVVETTLSNLVVEVRDALDDSRSAPAFVRTVHGVGYAFAGDAVEAGSARATGSPRGDHAATGPTPFWIVWKDRPVVLAPGENVIGRDAACEVWIDVTGVSRRHACIRTPTARASGHVTIEDLESTNGTFVEGTRVSGRCRLENGQRIRVGRATLVFRASSPQDAPTKRVRPPRSSR